MQLDTDSLTRKRSLYILKLMISKFLADMLIKEEKNNAESNSNEVIELKRSNDVGKRGKHTEKLPKGSTKTDSQAENFGILLKRHNLSDYWGAYVLLLETLEEFAFHLTEDAWPSQVKLYFKVELKFKFILKSKLLEIFRSNYLYHLQHKTKLKIKL